MIGNADMLAMGVPVQASVVGGTFAEFNNDGCRSWVLRLVDLTAVGAWSLVEVCAGDDQTRADAWWWSLIRDEQTRTFVRCVVDHPGNTTLYGRPFVKMVQPAP